MSLFIVVSTWRNEIQTYVTAGTLLFDKEYTDFSGVEGIVGFVYDQDYLKSGFPPLDPKHLNLDLPNGSYTLPLGRGILPHYFQQCLPGPFADQLLASYDKNWAYISQFEKLWTATHRYGDFNALQLSPHSDQFNQTLDCIDQLTKLVTAIRTFQNDRETSPFINNETFSTLCNMSGNRPKLDFFDKTDKKRYVVKLNNTSYYNDAQVAGFISTLASQAGIDTVEGHVRTIANEDLFFQTNFTHHRNDPEEKLYKYNRVSFRVLLSDFEAGSHTINKITYQHLADAIRLYSVNADEDIRELFRRAYFSASINHTNNNLDNIEMVDLGNNQWRLAPAYTALPTPYFDTEFSIPFDENLTARNLFNLDEAFLQRLAASIDIPLHIANDLKVSVDTAIKSSRNLISSHSLSSTDIDVLNQSIQHANLKLDKPIESKKDQSFGM